MRAKFPSLSRIAREPLAQFMIAGAVLFLVNSLVNGGDEPTPTYEITVSEGRIRQLAESYRLLSGRFPSETELQALVDDFIQEEIAYREAVAMGLDADDTIVRRRMRQKLDFLVEDTAAGEEPTEEELKAWFVDHADLYRLPRRISFRHILANGDARGDSAEKGAAAFLSALEAGAEPGGLGDASMLPEALPLTTQQGVAALFGEDFAATVFETHNEEWFGPVTSPFGAHAVLILSREAARSPAFEDVREKLRADWADAKRKERREEFHDRMRKRYDVTVNWPEAYLSQIPDDIATVSHDMSAE
ncbi:peptidyl-prolyl cis-trans isomerase [Hyphococcus sp.]|jgi:hypothetical protein|uniref:peptidylprolyl isomerase n=1 Tax=Hyphococcus sp. TaxID=2038636 RepID=UPI003D109B6A